METLSAEQVGRVGVRDPIHGGTACLLILDQLDPEVLLDTAADTVARWLRVVRPGVRAAIQTSATVRDRRAVRLSATYLEQRDGPATAFRCDVYVFELEGQYVALCFDAPERGFDALELDFTRMLQSVDLYPSSGGPRSPAWPVVSSLLRDALIPTGC